MRYSLVLLFASIGLLQGCVAPVVAAGVGTGVMMTTSDRRSAGTMIEDDTIESKAQQRVDEKYKDTAHASVTAYNRFALVTGSVANESAKMDIERIIGAVPNVKGIANELVVGATAGLGAASTDTRITANVKMRFVKSTAFKADHVKVVTENSVVYLMGLVTRAEADAASEIASTTAGVQKVVRVFEYID
ncbi:MAG: BON domain-containing protein [Gammaproteobacteria bacterium]|nr:BON domain-containing protein [Gammaproteobacteria bacterium]MBU1482488.1 BON domain-containing protein [Gammaproteobacteria bacterium]